MRCGCSAARSRTPARCCQPPDGAGPGQFPRSHAQCPWSGPAHYGSEPPARPTGQRATPKRRIAGCSTRSAPRSGKLNAWPQCTGRECYAPCSRCTAQLRPLPGPCAVAPGCGRFPALLRLLSESGGQRQLGALAFPIYLIHVFVQWLLARLLAGVEILPSGWPFYLILFFGTLLFSTAAAWGAGLLPFSEYLTGARTRPR
jgi:hypothetical protein